MDHFLHQAGYDSVDPRVPHLISVMAQKHLLEILKNAHTICKAKAAAAAAVAAVTATMDETSVEDDYEPEPKRRPPMRLTTEDLEEAVRERGISLPKPLP